ncbi:hypothetical protein F4604DRAFT_1923109 [Suillus subluteus]|nr:hypothetical protein F4604DRAFT_1923109 [Suillus subluteus]
MSRDSFLLAWSLCWSKQGMRLKQVIIGVILVSGGVHETSVIHCKDVVVFVLQGVTKPTGCIRLAAPFIGFNFEAFEGRPLSVRNGHTEGTGFGAAVWPATAAAGGWDGGAERGAKGAAGFKYEVDLDEKV